MATLFPDKNSIVYDDLDGHGSAEKYIIEQIEKLDPIKTKNWVFFYSYIFKYRNINEYKGSNLKSKNCEIDFLCLLPDCGIFVFEIKGGKISYNNELNKYTTTNRNGDINIIVDPYYQSKSNMQRLIETIGVIPGTNNLKITDYVWDYLVGFPDMQNDAFIRDDLRHSTYIKNMNLYTFFMEASKKGDKKPDQKIIDLIIMALKNKNFEYNYTINDYLDTVNVKLDQLTETQKMIMYGLYENKRCLVKGAAGTGKTVLCEFIFKNELANNERIAYFSYNRLNAEKVRREVNIKNSSVCEPFNDYLEKLYEKLYHRSFTFDKDSKSWEESRLDLYKALAVKSFENDFPKFNSIIIDEAQDLNDSDDLICLLDNMINGGIQNGRLFIFYDDCQKIFGKNETKLYENEAFGDTEKGYRYTKYELYKNCRNSEEIKDVLMHYRDGSIKEKKYSIVNNSSITSDEFNTIELMLSSVLEKIKNLIKKENVKEKDITILTKENKVKTQIINYLSSEIVIDEYSADSNNITIANVQRFKGLENNIIIYVTSGDWNTIDYTAISRAKACCYIYKVSNS